MLGCSLAYFITYIERQWLPGMSWENYGRNGWHIDHKKPCAGFDLSDPEQQRVCFHHTNMQPLWARDNLSKNDRWSGKDMEANGYQPRNLKWYPAWCRPKR